MTKQEQKPGRRTRWRYSYKIEKMGMVCMDGADDFALRDCWKVVLYRNSGDFFEVVWVDYVEQSRKKAVEVARTMKARLQHYRKRQGYCWLDRKRRARR